jgi:hypothetical protein
MTQETMIVIGLDDISSIRFDCKCGGSVAITAGSNIYRPIQCPQCGESMANDSTVFTMVSGFINGLATALKLKRDQFTIRLVLKSVASRASGE